MQISTILDVNGTSEAQLTALSQEAAVESDFAPGTDFTGNFDPYTCDYDGVNPYGLQRLREALPLAWAVQEVWSKWQGSNFDMAMQLSEVSKRTAAMDAQLYDVTQQRIAQLQEIVLQTLRDVDPFDPACEAACKAMKVLKDFDVEPPEVFCKGWLVDVCTQVLAGLQKNLGRYSRSRNRNLLRHQTLAMSLVLAEHLRSQAREILEHGLSFELEDDEVENAEQLKLNLQAFVADPIEASLPEPHHFKLVEWRRADDLPAKPQRKSAAH